MQATAILNRTFSVGATFERTKPAHGKLNGRVSQRRRSWRNVPFLLCFCSAGTTNRFGQIFFDAQFSFKRTGHCLPNRNNFNGNRRTYCENTFSACVNIRSLAHARQSLRLNIWPNVARQRNEIPPPHWIESTSGEQLKCRYQNNRERTEWQNDNEKIEFIILRQNQQFFSSAKQ